MNVVSESKRMDISCSCPSGGCSVRPCRTDVVGRSPPGRCRGGSTSGADGLSLDLLDGAPRRLVHRDRAVGVLDAVLLEDLEALFLPRAGDAEDRDLLG